MLPVSIVLTSVFFLSGLSLAKSHDFWGVARRCRLAQSNLVGVSLCNVMLSASAVITIYSANAIADSPKGTYGSTGIETCLASSGFNTSRQALGTTYSVSTASEGVATFNRDGTGSFTQNGTTIVPPPTVGFLPGASSSLISADGRNLTSSILTRGARILTAGLETLTYSNGDVEHRICYLQRV